MSDNAVHSLRILVVDDEAVVRDSLRGWFEEDGHTVGTAADAREGLTLLKEGTWDLALVDIMPVNVRFAS